ncbi:unnamed protein product [Prorocentrum cordatum]|uniref:Nucleotide-diphospho-sugar transferase domain-containing protein n=1 Tax=Prorocentrum cordatum TaxID=2364126 RepID=A0ABN9S8W6_9DINO|nr:unnamed protein product [Polarella glacialis]
MYHQFHPYVSPPVGWPHPIVAPQERVADAPRNVQTLACRCVVQLSPQGWAPLAPGARAGGGRPRAAVGPARSPWASGGGPGPECPQATGAGLPEDAVLPRPRWLLNEDRLAAAGAAGPPGAGGADRILLAQPVLLDRGLHDWGQQEPGGPVERPGWLRAVLSSNRAQAQRHGHTMVLRWRPVLMTPHRLAGHCNGTEAGRMRDQCQGRLERENFNWEKERMMLDYLRSPQNFSHVLVLDADAALVHPERDTLSAMSAELRAAGKPLLLTDEDWSGKGRGRINGGLLFAENSHFTRELFEDILDAHWHGYLPEARSLGHSLNCEFNEQLCLNGLWRYSAAFRNRTRVASGRRYNRGGCVLQQCGREGASDARGGHPLHGLLETAGAGGPLPRLGQGRHRRRT